MFQANLQRNYLATSELMLEANKRQISLALLQEPYVGRSKCMGHYGGVRVFQGADQRDGPVKAAIAVFDQNLDVRQFPKLTTNNIVVVSIRTCTWEITVVSYYFEPDQPIEPYLEQLKKIQKELQPKMLLIGGDANAKNTWWGGDVVNWRGEEMSGVIGEMDLQVAGRWTREIFPHLTPSGVANATPATLT